MSSDKFVKKDIRKELFRIIIFTFREKGNMKKEKSFGAEQRLIALFRKQELLGCDFSVLAVIAMINVMEIFVERKAHRSSNMREKKNWFYLAFLINY